MKREIHMSNEEDALNELLTAEFDEIEAVEEVVIPTLDGQEIADRIPVKVTALKSKKTGKIYFDGRALKRLDEVKARHMGPLTQGPPAQGAGTDECSASRRSTGGKAKSADDIRIPPNKPSLA